MNYLILAAGMGRRMQAASNGRPKCLLEIDGRSLLERLLDQIRRRDPGADITVVAGFRSQEVAVRAKGCRIVLNPFFDVTGINASIWFAREQFCGDLMMINGDIAFSDPLMDALAGCSHPTYICYDSSIRNPKELNVRVRDGRIEKFGVNFADFHGAYSGVIRFSADDAALFARLLERRVSRGFNDPITYYFAFIRSMINDCSRVFHAFDFADYAWTEIDYPADLARARTLFD